MMKESVHEVLTARKLVTVIDASVDTPSGFKVSLKDGAVILAYVPNKYGENAGNIIRDMLPLL
jgi:hypothetical protein